MEEELVDKLDFEDQDEESEEEEVDEIPHEQRHLRTQPYDKSISDLVSMIKTDDIVLNPEYQRNYVWDNKRASLLIESILLNVPIPVIYVSEEDDGRWSVVDGLQRLNSLARYFDNEYGLRGLEILSELNKIKYKDLNPKAARLLRNGTIRVILILKESHHEIKYDIFMRLNRGAVKLTEQELRNCLYRGNLNNLLLKARENAAFLKMIDRSEVHKRMADAEMVLRFFMFSNWFNINTMELEKYSGNMRSSLNKYMNEYKNISEEHATKMMVHFEHSVNAVQSVFGGQSFKRYAADESYDDRMNRAVMDVQMVVLGKLDSSQIESKADVIRERFEKLCLEDEFVDSILIRTSNKSKTHYRLKAFAEAVLSQ